MCNTLSPLCFKSYLLPFCSILIMVIYSLVYIWNKAIFIKDNQDLVPAMRPQQWQRRAGAPNPTSVGGKVSRTRPAFALLPAELPQSWGRITPGACTPPCKVCVLWIKWERSEGFLPAGLRMHLADTCCPQPQLCAFEEDPTQLPESTGCASSMLSFEPPSFCFTPGEPS